MHIYGSYSPMIYNYSNYISVYLRVCVCVCVCGCRLDLLLLEAAREVWDNNKLPHCDLSSLEKLGESVATQWDRMEEKFCVKLEKEELKIYWVLSLGISLLPFRECRRRRCPFGSTLWGSIMHGESSSFYSRQYSMVKGESMLSLSSNSFGIPKTVEHVTWQGEIDWTLPAAKNDSW